MGCDRTGGFPPVRFAAYICSWIMSRNSGKRVYVQRDDETPEGGVPLSAPLGHMTVAEIRAKARADADRVLRETWKSDALPVQPVTIARALGLGVFNAQLGDDAWGMLVGSNSGVDMYLDQDQPLARWRFSCAHEIGHFVDRGMNLAPDEAFVEKRSDEDRGRADEIYANEFAGSLLMPASQFVAAIRSGEDRFDLAQRFDVSLDAVHWRRVHLGV